MRRIEAAKWGTCGWVVGLVVVVVQSAQAGLPAAQVAQRVDKLLAEEVLVPEGQPAAPHAGDETLLRRMTFDLVGAAPTPADITAYVLDPADDKRVAVIDRLLDDERFGQNWARYWRDVFMYRRGDDRALLSVPAGVEYLTEAFNSNMPWDELARSLVTASGSLSENGAGILLASQWGVTEDTASEVSRVLLGVQIQCAQCHDHPTDRWQRAQFHELAAFFPRMRIRNVGNKKPRDFRIVSFDKTPRRKKANKPVPAVEHYMPDLNDPSAQGTLMEPVFFVTGEKVELGTSDQDRRQQLAEWMTARDNPWFARAYVNRVWAELVGEGFYEPIDDLGPDRTCSAPKTLQALAGQFVAHDYDAKWLYRTIMLTDAYARESRPPREPDTAPFAATCTQRMRADQVFDALVAALGIEDALAARGPENPRRGPRSPRGLFGATFGYDPSDPRSEVTGTIPQALMLMNASALNRAISAKGRAPLGKLLAEFDDDEALCVELYLRCLSREPTDDELAACLAYVDQVQNRAEAFEDLLWALVNSTEFLYRR